MQHVTTLARSIVTAMLLAGSALLTAALPPAAAETDAVWSVKPADNEHGNGRANYAFSAQPGESIADAVVVTNYSTSPLTLSVYAADGFTTAQALLDLIPAGTESTDLGAWVTVDATTITLDPGAQETVAFTVEVPADVTPGDHTGGLVTSLTGSAEGTNLAVDRRLAAKINVRVAGELAVRAAVTDVRVDYHRPSRPWASGTATVTYRIANTGNALMYATDRTRLSGPLGLGSATTAPAEVPEILPGSAIERQVEINGVWPLGRVTASIEVQPVGIGVSGSPTPVQGDASNWALSWVWIAVLAVVLLIALVVLVRALRSRRRTPGHMDDGGSDTGTRPVADDDLAARLEQARAEGRARARELASTNSGDRNATPPP